jgi:hypothetical protein
MVCFRKTHESWFFTRAMLPTTNFLSGAANTLPSPPTVLIADRNNVYYPHFPAKNCLQQIRWFRALDTPFSSSPPIQHRHFRFRRQNSQQVYHGSTLKSVRFVKSNYIHPEF